MLRRTRRASSACAWCHYRKVRCDASILGCPCTRCRQDGRSNCVLRAKLPKQSKLSANASSSSHAADSPAKRGNFVASAQWTRLSAPEKNPMLHHLRTHVDNPEALRNLTQYPFLISESFQHLLPEDLAYLCSSGCFSLPERRLTEVFIEQYFKKMHPVVPVLEELKIWETFQSDAEQDVSLFILQALLFASCPFVSLRILRECGFSDKRDARKQLYDRAMRLYDLGFETKASVKAQGALLLTHHTSAEAPQAGSLWLTRAIENATLIDAPPSLSPENVPNSMRRRLWWSILLRDRSLCIGLRRPPQITSANIHQCREWLTEQDFQEEIYHSTFHEYETKKRILAALQEQCQLAVMLTDLMSLIFAPRVTSETSSTAKGRFYTLMGTIGKIKESMFGWKAQTVSPPPPSAEEESYEPAVYLRHLTFMYYHAALVGLAQFTALAIEEHLPAATITYKEAIMETAKDLQVGIHGLSRVMEYFSIHGHVGYLPLSVLGYVGMPLVLAAIDLKLSPSYNEMKRRQERLHSLSKIIRYSEALYDVTDFVAVGINHILHLAYLTTQKFFLSGPNPSQSSGEAQRSGKMGNYMSIESWAIDTESPRCERAKSWSDAFIRCPRAYLLVSTSVDYSLAVGRLPYESALPTLVRHIPSIGPTPSLPWTAQSERHGRAPKDQFPPHEMPTNVRRVNFVRSKVTVEVSPTGHEEQRPPALNMLQDRSAGLEGFRALTRVDRTYKACQPGFQQSRHSFQPSLINLDFLDLANIYEDHVGGADTPNSDNMNSLPCSSMHRISPHTIENLRIQDNESGVVRDALDSLVFQSIFPETPASSQACADFTKKT